MRWYCREHDPGPPSERACGGALGDQQRRMMMDVIENTVHALAHRFRARHGLPVEPGLEAHDALHEILDQPPTPRGEFVVLVVQVLLTGLALTVPEDSALGAVHRALRTPTPEVAR